MNCIFRVVALTLIIVAPLSVSAQWSGPSGAPTSGNVSAPINVGTSAQVKNGGLSVNAFTAWSNAYFAQNVGVGVVTPSYRLDVAGTVGATAYYYTSDQSLKKNVYPLSGSLDKILKLKGVSFEWKKDGRQEVGLIAQDVEQVYPEVVHTSETTGLKSVQYGNLIAPLIEALKEQQKQIDALKAEIEILKRQ